MKKKSIKFILGFFIIFIIAGYFFIYSTFNNPKFDKIKSVLNEQQKQIIKKYVFPYKYISQQKDIMIEKNLIINQLKQLTNLINFELEIDKKISGSDIKTTLTSIELSNNRFLKKYLLLSGFYSGIKLKKPGTGYIDFHEDKIFVISARGILAFSNISNDDEMVFKQVKNNIEDFISIEQFNKSNKYSIKDLLIFNKKIYVSFTDEIKEDCWNTSIIYGDMNYHKIQFKKLFTPKECIHSKNNPDKEFSPSQSGGRIFNFDKNHILFSIGDYRSRFLAQDIKSVNGKIIKINTTNQNFEIISMGHRNPQGLFFDNENKFILETEHGPKGGDEINLIQIDINKKNEIPNYGWPIVSAGEHYDEVKSSEKYPLSKSHTNLGFVEPLKSFVPSIAISEILKIGKNKYVVGSMKDKSIYFFSLDEHREINNLERVEVFERVRDLRFNNNRLFLFMENTPSIGIIDLI